MIKTLSILFIFISSLNFSQTYLDAKIVKTTNDTINSKIKIYTNIFNKNILNEASFYKVVVLVDENNKKKSKIKAENIKELRFIDLEGKNKIYLNNGKTLKELMFQGKNISWFRAISQNLYDSSIQYSDYLIDEKGKEYKLGSLNNIKKKLKEITKSKPELENEIENAKITNATIINILKKFEE